MVEFTLVFPLLLVVALGTVDVGLMLSDRAQANKAAYIGAHRAIVSNPVAPGLATFFNDTIEGGMGLKCWDLATGDPAINPDTGTQTCLAFASVVCTSTAPCTSYGYDSTAFTNIFTLMQGVFPRLQPTNVTISYERGANLNNVGHNEPNGFPMTVTVSITGMTSQFYFIGPLVSFFGTILPTTPGIPQFSSSLTSEDMCTDGTVMFVATIGVS
jgi:Flp pilus assembly protein TadG